MENAAARAEEACIYFSHTRPDKSKFDTAITVERYSSAENLAKLYSRDGMEMIAEAAVEKWMDSESHKKQLLEMCIRDRPVTLLIPMSYGIFCPVPWGRVWRKHRQRDASIRSSSLS